MKDVKSPITDISKIKYKERPFDWWGPSPKEARAIQVSKSRELKDKRTTLKDAVKNSLKMK